MHRVAALLLLVAGVSASGQMQPLDAAAVQLRVASVGPHEIVLELGPFDLPAMAMEAPGSGGEDMHMMAMAEPPVRVITWPADGWLHGFRFELVDGGGRPVPSTVLHHVNVIAPQRRELFSNIMLRLAAAGAETGPVELPSVLGYRVSRNDSVLVVGMLHNPTPRSYTGVRLRMHVTFTPAAGAWLRPLAIYPFYMDVMPPAGSHSFDVPPGRSERSWEGSPAVAGRILGVGGHVHKYGASLRLEDVTDGKRLWEGRPEVGRAGDITGFPIARFWWRLGVPMRPDHVYRLTVIYENPTGHVIADGGMGALGGAFLPEDAGVWPLVARNNPEYRLDRQITYRESAGDAGDRGSVH